MGFLPFFLVYFTVTVTASLVDDQPYCAVRYRRLCQGKGRHVGCQFPEVGPGMSCENYIPIQFQNDLKNFITHFINSYPRGPKKLISERSTQEGNLDEVSLNIERLKRRQRIAAGTERVRGGVHLPKPEIMMLVEWDRELASLAQRLADQCTFVHDDCRATVRYPYAGQTVGEVRWRKSSDSETLTAQRAIRRVFDAWWGERRRVQPHQLTAPFKVTAKGAVWGHFSQLAVWSLRAVGCGAVRHGTSVPKLLLVCDFSHTNMLGQRTLSPGPMMPCPIHTARRPRSAYPLLCAPVRHRIRPEQYDFEPEEEALDTEDDNTEPTTRRKPSRNVTRVMMTVKPPTRRTDWKSKILVQTKDRITYDQASKEDELETSDILFRSSVTVFRRKTKGTIVDRLENEFEDRQKAQHKYYNMNNWPPRPAENWRAQSQVVDDSYEVIPFPTKRRKGTAIERFPDGKDREAEREKKLNAAADFITATASEPILIVRHKWQQPRDRPQRPGANALLNIPVTVHTRRSSGVGMKLDKEDVDQLFRDTGFNPSFKKERF